jgi:hypothetical protein
MEKKIISLEEIYNQVQTMLEDAGIPTATLSVEGSIKSYQHRKEGKYEQARMTPDKQIQVYIGKDGMHSIHVTHWSPSVVLHTIKVELEKVKISMNPEDKIEDMQIEVSE